MSLIVVTGRPNAGKTGVLHDVVRKAVEARECPAVLLPSMPDARTVTLEFARNGPRLGVDVRVLNDYIDALWALHGDGRRIVGPSERRYLISRAIRQTELSTLTDSVRRAGLPRLLAPLASNLSAHVSYAGRTSGLAGDVLEILGSYGRLLEASGGIERAEVARWLAEHARAAWFPGPLVVNRFADLRVFQERFLSDVSRHADVWLSLVWEEGFAATRALDPLVTRLRASGAQIVRVPSADYTRSEELRYVESHLFLDPSTATGATTRGDVRLSKAFGEDAEAERIVAEVQLALSSGVPPEQIAIVFQHVVDHAPALRASFLSAGIDASFDVAARPRDTAWGSALLQLLEFAVRGERSALLGFLRGPCSGEEREAVEVLEAYWRRYRLERPSQLAASLSRYCPATEQLVQRLFRLIDRPWDSDLAGEWKNLADRLLRNAHGGAGKPLDEAASLDVAAHRKFLRLLSDLEALAAGSEVEGVNVRTLELASMLEDLTLSSSQSAREGSVRVMSASRARSQRFRVVIIGGLVAGDFPPPSLEDALLTPEVISALRMAGVDVDRKNERDAARLTFYLVASRATERLVLSRQVASSDGAELRASWLWDEFLDLYRDPAAEDVPPEALPPSFTLTFDERTPGDAPRSPRRVLRASARSGDASPDGVGSTRLALARLRARPRGAVLADERVLAGLSERQDFSATEIEAYLRCPYAWFHERAVRARPLEPETGPLELGRVCHDVLHTVFSELTEAGEARVTHENLRTALVIAERALAEQSTAGGAVLVDGKGSCGSGLETRAGDVGRLAVGASAARRVRGFLRAEADFLPGFVPLAHELEFDDADGHFQQFRLRGRIDRVDHGPGGGLLLADYKTGQVGAEHSARKFAETGLVQLGLYAKVAEAHFGEPVIGGLYRRVSSQNVAGSLNRGFVEQDAVRGPGFVSRDLMSRDEIRAIVADAEERASEAVQAIRSGDIAPRPRQTKTCQRCNLRKSCPGARS